MASIRSIFVTGSNQGALISSFHLLWPNSRVRFGTAHHAQVGSNAECSGVHGSRKISAADDALAEFKSDVHASSTTVPVRLDITDAASVKNAHAFIQGYLKAQNLPGLDVLVNNAAIFGMDFQQVYTVNIFGTVAVTKAIRPLINNGGAIVNISSGLGSMDSDVYTKKPAPPIALAYSSSKEALNSLTVQWAVQEEQLGSGIRIVCICPGFNKTNLNKYTGTEDPANGCMVIVKAVLEKEGRTAVFFNKDGDIKW
ncbi:hypothetical protein C8J57DRAFT_1594962 [Mycena rebaudengoi]|nr:hypothetical protein C8J57DRAFT_1594962 [Mycena rebaudengoi]